MLRPARPDDALAIATVWHDAWIDGHLGHVPEGLARYRRLEDFQVRVPPRIPATTVFTIDHVVVGFVTVKADELEELFVLASARGGGVAKALLGFGEREIAKAYPLAWLAVATGNGRARHFYERQGWSDAAPLEYAAEVEGGTFIVPCRRYEKRVDFL